MALFHKSGEVGLVDNKKTEYSGRKSIYIFYFNLLNFNLGRRQKDGQLISKIWEDSRDEFVCFSFFPIEFDFLGILPVDLHFQNLFLYDGDDVQFKYEFSTGLSRKSARSELNREAVLPGDEIFLFKTKSDFLKIGIGKKQNREKSDQKKKYFPRPNPRDFHFAHATKIIVKKNLLSISKIPYPIQGNFLGRGRPIISLLFRSTFSSSAEVVTPF